MEESLQATVQKRCMTDFAVMYGGLECVPISADTVVVALSVQPGRDRGGLTNHP